MGRAAPAPDAVDGALDRLGTLAVQGASLAWVPLFRALSARGRLRLRSWPPEPSASPPDERDSEDEAEAPVALLVCEGLSTLPPRDWNRFPRLAVSTRALDDMPGGWRDRMQTGTWLAAGARAYQGFVTPGWLGAQQLLALGVPRQRIAVGWGALDADAWRAEVGPARPLRGKRRTALLSADSSCATGSERDASEAVVRALEKTLRLVPVAEADARAFATADLFIQLGTREPWSEPLLRAAMVGLPLVSSCCARAADLVLPGRTGQLLASLDPAEALVSVTAALALPRAQVKATLLRLTATLEATRAAEAVEQLVQSLSTPAPWRPLHRVMDDLFRNRWGWAPR